MVSLMGSAGTKAQSEVTHRCNSCCDYDGRSRRSCKHGSIHAKHQHIGSVNLINECFNQYGNCLYDCKSVSPSNNILSD
jgi:hypothetical protein